MINRIKDSEAFLIFSGPKSDNRGSFTKMYSKSWLKDIYNFNPKESFSSISYPKVLRGFHLQINEDSHSKIVSCLCGEILDVIVDLRKGINFGKVYSVNLTAKLGNSIFIPKGYGHAFLNASKHNALVNYIVDSEYSPKNDVGVKWNSVNFNWPIKVPILSERDNNFADIKDFPKL
tara:strand:- start:2329 stop:2856 length:528 start_codon:yes stop_codon:yes gene_type:complete